MTNSTKALMAAFAVALLTCSVFNEQAQAVPITGGISLAGGYTVNTGNLNTATAFTGFNNVITTSMSGSYIGLPAGTSVMMNGFSFNPFVAAIPLWTFMSGGRTYSFDLTTLISRIQTGNDALELRGSGTLRISGVGPVLETFGTISGPGQVFDPTFGTWIFTANQAGGTFSFSSSNAAGQAVPDGGSALALLGIGLAAVEALRRKLAAS